MRTDRAIEKGLTKPPFVWNAGAWWGSQLGGSAWALVGGVALLFEDILAAVVCLAAFAVFNAYGLHLWRSRERLSAYGGIQRLLLACTLFCAIIFVTLDLRGTSEAHTPAGAIPTHIPYGFLALPPVMMLWCYFQQRAARRRSA